MRRGRLRIVAMLSVALLLAPLGHAGAYDFGRTLRRGDRGKAVKALEVRVTGWYKPRHGRKRLPINKRFGAKTKRAVKAFQSHYGLEADGIAGPATFEVLNRLEDRNGSTAHFAYKEFKQNRNSGCSAQANAYAGTFRGGAVSRRRTKSNVRRLMWRLEAVRAKAGGHPVGISSGFRSSRYNDCIGGASSSQHLYGTAADNRVASTSNRRARKKAKRSQLSGIGCYASLTHNHMDIRLDNWSLPAARYWWWPERDRKGRDLDESGVPCWGERPRKGSQGITSGPAAELGSGLIVPSAREVRAFEAVGEPDDLRGAD